MFELFLECIYNLQPPQQSSKYIQIFQKNLKPPQNSTRHFDGIKRAP